MPRMTGGEAVVACLAAQGVDTVFGIPGVHNLAIYEALRRTPSIRAITTRHEGGAGFMADGYARATGRPGVCLTITGPGAANALAPLTNAYADSSPVLLVASEVDTRERGLGRGAFHEIPGQLDMLAGAVGWAEHVSRVEDIPAAVERAWDAMLGRRPRPAALQIPLDVLMGEGEITLPEPYSPQPSAPDHAALDQAAAWVAQAESPIVYAGQGVLASGASDALARLADRVGAPVLTTCSGRGAIPQDHPLSLGYGWTGPGAPFAALLAEADLVLVVGSSLDLLESRAGALPVPPQVVQIDIDSREIGKQFPHALPIVADARAALAHLADTVPPAPQRRERVVQRIAALRAEGQRRVERGLGWRMMQAIRAAAPRSAIITGDAAAVNGWQITHLPVYEPRTAPFPWHNAALGFAFPAALGARVAQPDRAAIAICGDGGALFTLQELATAVHYAIPVVVIVANDGGYRSIENYQRRMFGHPYAGELTNPDFVRLAEAFGALGLRAETPDALERAVRSALAAHRPTVIEISGAMDPARWE